MNEYIKTHPAVSRKTRIAVRERVINVDVCCTIEHVAGFLGHAELRERMVSDGLIYADGLPYQHYDDCGYIVATKRDDSKEPDVWVTPDGMSWLYNRYGMTDEARHVHQAAKAIQ